MNYPLFLARRLSLGNGGKSPTPAVTVAISAVAISVAVMIASIAIVLGFKKEIREKVVGFNGHISIFRLPLSENDDNLITLDDYLKQTLDSESYITDYYVTASIPAILKTSDDFKGVYLRGLSDKAASYYIGKNVEEGEIPDFLDSENDNKIIISRKAANQLKLAAGDKIDTYFISDDVKVRRLEIAAIYNSHFEQYDDVLIFGSMNLIAKLGNLPENTGTYVVVETPDFAKIPEYTAQLQLRLNQDVATGASENYYRLDNVLNQGRGFFSWLSLLDTNVVVIIILMMVVGLVTLVSGMLIIILERKKFIGLMRALGAQTSKIRNVFIYMSVRIAFIGIIIGDIVVLVLLYCQEQYHYLKLDADAYYIDFVPVTLPGWIVVALNGGVILVTYLVLVLPSGFVGKISPAESMLKAD